MNRYLSIVLAAMLGMSPLCAQADSRTQQLIATGQWQQVADALYQQAQASNRLQRATASSLARAGRVDEGLALARRCCSVSTQIDVARAAENLDKIQRLAILDGIGRSGDSRDLSALAAAYVMLGRSDQAVAVYRLLVDQQKHSPLALQFTLKDIRAIDDLQVMTALAPLLEAALDALPDSIEAAGGHAHLAYLWARQGRMQQAETALRRANKRVGWFNHDKIANLLVDVALQIDRADLARDYGGNATYSWINYRVRQGDYQEAMRLAKAVEDYPQRAIEHVRHQALLQVADTAHPEALAAFFDSFKAEQPSVFMQGMVSLANRYADQQQPAQARVYLQRAADSVGGAQLEAFRNTIELTLQARRLAFDDLAKVFNSQVYGMLPQLPGMLESTPDDQASAWLWLSQLDARNADDAMLREHFGRAYSAVLNAPQGDRGSQRFKAEERRTGFLLAMAERAQKVADAPQAN